MSVDDLVAELTAHADDATRPALRPIIERLTRPLRVRATGRVGVGVHTLTDALRDAGLTVADARAEVEVLVIAETAKPEDRQSAAAARGRDQTRGMGRGEMPASATQRGPPHTGTD